MQTTAEQLQAILERPQFNHVLPRDAANPFMTTSWTLMKDKTLSVDARFLMSFFVNKSPDWEGWRLPVEAVDILGCCLKSAEKYIGELVDAGYLHKIAHLGDGPGHFIYAYKVTEMAMKVEGMDPRSRTWVKDYHRQPYHTRKQPAGFGKPRRGRLRGNTEKPQKERKERSQTPEVVKACAPKDTARARRRASFFGDSGHGNNYRANKGWKEILHSSESLIPLTPFSKGDEVSLNCRVEDETPTPVTHRPGHREKKGRAAAKGKKATARKTKVASRKVNKARERAAFDACHMTSPMASPALLEPVRLPDAEMDGEWVATWGVRDAQNVTMEDVEAFVAHPVSAMLQMILGYSHWLYRDAYRWTRVAGRVLSAWEVIDFYRSFVEDFNAEFVPERSWAARVRELLLKGDWHRVKAPWNYDEENPDMPLFRTYADCRQEAIWISNDLLERPDDLEAYYAYCAERAKAEAEMLAKRGLESRPPSFVRFAGTPPELVASSPEPPAMELSDVATCDYDAFSESLAEFGADTDALVEAFISKLNP